MAWTSTQVTQNGNTTVTWSVGPHSSLSTHDCVVLRPESGNSGMRIEYTTVFRNPTRYHMRVRVVGSDAMAFKFAAEQMD
jgi:hypothetical protein